VHQQLKMMAITKKSEPHQNLGNRIGGIGANYGNVPPISVILISFIIMKRLWFVFGFLFCGWLGYGQSNCSSLRYQDSIYHKVDTLQGIYYATANPFGLNPSEDLYLDVYRPANDSQKHRPLIVFQHGGSFMSGSRNQTIIPAYATYFAKCGYVVASIDYRLGFDPLSTGSAERAVYRAIQDLRASVRFLCQNADVYGIDTASVVLTGTSAGCISGVCSAFFTQAQFPTAIYGTLTESSYLGGIDSSGNADFGNRYVKPRALISHWGAILDTTYITDADSIPLLGIQGTADQVVPYDVGHPYSYPIFPIVYGELPIHIRMDNLHIRNKLVPLAGAGHEPEQSNPVYCDTMNNEGRRFLWRIFKPLTPVISGADTVCHMAPANYAVADAPGNKYCWQLTGNGTIISNQGNAISVLWADTGQVSVTLTVVNYMGAQADPVTFITWVLAPVKANFTFGVNARQTVFFVSNVLHADSVIWNFGNGDSSMLLNPVETFAAGSYNVSLIAINTGCGVNDTFIQQVIIDSCPGAVFTYQLQGLNAFFHADTTNTALYDWNFGDGQVANVATPHVLHQYAHSGTYSVTLNEESAQGCKRGDTVVIQVYNTGIESTEAGQVSINCYVNGGCQFSTNQPGLFTLEVIDLLGRRVKSIQVKDDYKLNTSDLTPGVYLLRAFNETESTVKKFVVR
jgi:PKD repeat protein